ncbi:MAG: site-specific tyrosine recombinase/integron integrase [Candidatus Brennerbacteria bacterium]
MTEMEKLVKEYLDYLEIEKGHSRKTQENYGRYLAVFIKEAGVKTARAITQDVVRKFRLTLARKDLKKVTQSYYVIALRNFLKYLIRRGMEVLSPETIELPKIARRDIKVLSYDELERLLASPKGNDLRAFRDRAILETFFSTGLRLSELCALPRYLDLTRGELSVRGKGEKVRMVFISERAKKTLKEYLDKRPDTEEKLFVSLSRAGKVLGPITPRAVERLVELHARKAGIAERVHPHELRHSFATDLLVNGADLRSVQELLGHANVATTQIYTHLTNKELREVHKSFHGRRR